MSRVHNLNLNHPSHGGHAQGRLHETFQAAVDAYELWDEREPEPELEVGHERRLIKISEICGLVWNCTDTMPAWLCDQIESFSSPFPYNFYRCRIGSSYAAGARRLKTLIGVTTASN